MNAEVTAVAGLLLGAGAAYALTPVAMRLAARYDFYDKPAGYKGHGRPTPYLGGIAVIAAFTLVLLVLAGHPGQTAPLLIGMVVLLVVGTVDDRVNISPLGRVVVEIGMAVLLWATDLGWQVGAGAGVDLVLTIGWVVAVVNALNLFDNMDGAASTMAAVVAAIVAVLGITHDNEWLAVAAAGLCGACAGFLPHNLSSPARIFLGDGGSMPIGFAVATLVMVGSSEAAPAGQSLLLGMLLVGVPAVDTCMVIFSRRRRGVGVLTGGRDHLTHRTRQWLRTARAVALGLGAIQALVAVLAVFAIRGGSAVLLVILVLYVVTAVTAIAFLETRYEEATETTTQADAPNLAVTLPNRPGWLLAGAFGLALGLSPFASGLYSDGRWVPVGLVLMFLATAGAIARPVRVSRPQALVLGSLVGLGLVGLVSATWAPSIVQATTDANRWLALAAMYAGALVLLRSEQAARWLTGGLAVGVALVGGYVLIAMVGRSPSDVLLGGRLNQPLGYVNAEGTTFLMGFWLWFGLVEHRARAMASLGLAVATAMAGLVVLTQSRGAALAMAVSLLVVAVLPGRRVRRLFALLAIALGLVVVGSPLLDVYRSVGAPGDSRAGSVALVGASIGVGVAWWAAHAVLGWLAAARPAVHALMPRIGVGTLVVVAVAAASITFSQRSEVSGYVDGQWTAFVELSDVTQGPVPAGTVRLASGAGFRYDYWRVAWNTFLDQPLKGVGAGNYDRPYFRARATAEDIRQPHSLLLQELSELGLLGGILLCGLGGGVLWGFARAWRVGNRVSPVLAVSGAGATAAWFAHTNVDWIHLMPGVTGIALAMTAVALRPVSPGRPAPAPARGRGGPMPARLAAALASILLVVAAVSLSRQGLATLFRERAQDALADRPADAVSESDRSLRLDSENPRTYYVKAAALARFNDPDGARAVLEQALEKERDNYVTWTLLGDLAVRLGDFTTAKRHYQRALELNPTEPTLRSLAADPTQAVG